MFFNVLQGSMLVYLRSLKELYLPQWKNEEATHGDLESLFRITWAELTGYANQAAQGMKFLEENKVSLFLKNHYLLGGAYLHKHFSL
jgi:hypothetical protein